MLGRLIQILVEKAQNRKLQIIRSKFLRIGENCQLQNDIIISVANRISLGNDIYIGNGATLNGLGGVTIEDGVIIGPNVFIHSANHRFRDAEYLPYDQFHVFKEVVIKENVWIGANVCITPGTVIGEGAIVGMGTVLHGEIPAYSIVAGNPYKIIGKRDERHYNDLKKKDSNYLRAKKNGIITPDYSTEINNRK